MPDDDPVALRSESLVRWFTRYLRWDFGRRFHAVRISRPGLPAIPPDRPLIVFSNHASWWDPAAFFLLGAELVPGRPGFGPMEAGALKRYGVMKRLGVFGLDDSPRGAAVFARTAARILDQPRNTLWITAEGRFTDPRVRPLSLRTGIAHLARRHPGAVLLPLALEYSFWNESRPEALARFGRALSGDARRSVGAWLALLTEELETTMDALALDSAARDPARFVTLLHGGAGVGGPYDLWRRVAAAAAGRKFDPAHGSRP